MAETEKKKKQKKGQVRFRFPATVPEAVFRGGRALTRRIGREFRRPATGKAAPRGTAQGRRDTGPRKRPPPSQAFKDRELTREVEEMLGRRPGDTKKETAPAPRAETTAQPRATAAAKPKPKGFVARGRAAAAEKRREKWRMQGFTEAEIKEMEPGR